MRVFPKRLEYSSEPFLRLTHYLFRYPAKFHPPVARKLVELFTSRGETVLDPFCGSSTLAIEAAALGRNSLGVDIDPLAVFISRVKTQRLDTIKLKKTWDLLAKKLRAIERPSAEYVRRQFADIQYQTVQRVSANEGLWLPEIPNIEHWFRNYVLIDLARILASIESLDVPQNYIDFFLLCFASIIRNSSNADPVPVSGLEVTIHMKRKDAAGRIVNPFELLRKAVEKNIAAMQEYRDSVPISTSLRFYHADATRISRKIKSKVDAVITSPPYHSAVDYYRRHTLETYWLGLVLSPTDRGTIPLLL